MTINFESSPEGTIISNKEGEILITEDESGNLIVSFPYGCATLGLNDGLCIADEDDLHTDISRPFHLAAKGENDGFKV